MSPNTFTMKKNTQLVVASIITPRPTKREIAAAMLERAREKFLKDKEAENALRSELTKKRDAKAKLAMCEYIKRPESAFTVDKKWSGTFTLEASPTFDFSEFPALKAAQKALDDVPCTAFDEMKARKIIAAKLDNSPARIAQLLASPEACAALDKMLE